MSRVGRYSRVQITGDGTSSTTGLSPSVVCRSSTLRLTCVQPSEPGATGSIWIVQPRTGSARTLPTPTRFGLYPVRSPLLRVSSLFLGVLRCFSSPGSLPPKRGVTGHHAGRVAPFGDLWIAGCQRLPRAFRRVATSFIGVQRQGIHRVPIIPVAPSSWCHSTHFPARLVPRRDRETSPFVHSAGLPATNDSFLFQLHQTGWAPSGRYIIVPLRCQGAQVGRWSRGGSNPEPPPCKGGALPVELRPQPLGPVGAPGLEPGTSALSGPRSNQLSYAPAACLPWLPARRPKMEDTLHSSQR